MCSSLGVIGICWGISSVLSAILTSTGFFLPFWIEGDLVGGGRTSFGSFLRCGYPQLTDEGVIEILTDCGRYATFWVIPSGWWQISTVLVGLGVTTSLIIAATILLSIPFPDLINSTSAKFIGSTQLLSGLCVCAGMLLYPLGWSSMEVMETCSGGSGPYKLGTCKISWSIYLMGSGALLLLAGFGLSTSACRSKKGNYRI